MNDWIANFFEWIGELPQTWRSWRDTHSFNPFEKIQQYRNSLSFVVVTFMVVLALLPVSLVASATYLRSRSFLEDQTVIQLENLVKSQSPLLLNISNSNHTFITTLLAQNQIRKAINQFLAEPLSAPYQYIAWFELSSYLQANSQLGDTPVDSIIIVGPDFKVLTASKKEFVGTDLSGTQVIKEIYGTSKTFSIYSPASLYDRQWVTLSGRPLVNERGSVIATLVIASFPRLPLTVLETTSSTFSQGKAFFFSSDDNLIGINQRTKEIDQLPNSSTHTDKIKEIFKSQLHEGSARIDNPDLVPVFVYAKWLPEMNLGFMVEVPESVVFRQIEALVPFTFLLLAISLLLISGLTFFGSRILVGPIVQLTDSARNFAKGDWSERSSIRRRDEIGILATTFNQMVEEISDLYRSQEQKVEERTRQLRTASEVGQLATSASNREEIIERAVKLVIDRFGYSFASIFLMDQSGLSAVLQAAYSQSGEMDSQKGYRVPVNLETLVGWVSKSNKARVISDFSSSEFPYNNLILSSSQSEVALPIAIGNQVLGVFEVQSVKPMGFEQESISVLQTLANQIANGLQNLRLLEATQINLEETNLLYRTIRQISLTRSEAEMLQVVRDALVQTPYVSGLFSVEDSYMGIISITDPRSPATTAASQSITLPLLRVPALLENQPLVLVDDLSRPTNFDVLLSFFIRRGCHSAAIFAVLDQNKPTKILVLGSREEAPLTETTMQPFASLAEVIGTTSQRFRILKSLQERVSILQTLNTISESISSVTNLELLYITLHKLVGQALGENLGFLIAIYDQTKAQIEIPYIYEEDTLISIPPFPMGEGLTSYVIQSAQPLMIVNDTERRVRELGAKVLGKPAKSWMGVPLMLGNQVIGVMAIQDLEQEERFTLADLNMFTLLAPQVAVTVRNVQLLTEMKVALSAYDMERFLLNTLMDNIPDQVFFKDQTGQYIRVSQSYAQQFQASDPLTIVGKSDYDLWDQFSASNRRILDQKILDSGQPVLKNVEKQQSNDQTLWKQSSVIPMVNAVGQVMGLLGIQHDITELKKAEELAKTLAQQLQIAAEVARDTSGTLDTTQLLANAVNLVRDRFGFYHASIFLLDSQGEFAVLRESTGTVGTQMKERGHRLAVGSQSIVGQVSRRKEPWVVNDVSQEALYFANPLLPETRSEIAIPLIVGEKVLGVIDVQSKMVNAFLPDEVNVLRLMADQLAIAVWNSVLFGQTQENLAQHRLLHQITIAASSAASIDEALSITVQALHTATGGEHVMVLLLDQNTLQVRTAAGYEGVDFSNYTLKLGEGLPGIAVETRTPIRINDLQNHPEYKRPGPDILSELAVPIYFSGRTVGVLDLSSDQAGAYDETDQEILASLGNTLGAIIANAQLVREVRQQVERQQLLYDITSRIRRTTDIQTILQTSAREIAHSMGARRTHIEITADQTIRPPSEKSNGSASHPVEGSASHPVEGSASHPVEGNHKPKNGKEIGA